MIQVEVEQGELRLLARGAGQQSRQQALQVQAVRQAGEHVAACKARELALLLEALQHLRRRKRWQTSDLQHEPMDESRGHDSQAEHKELLEKALARIDPALRAIFLLREVEELSYREIAEALDIPAGTVGSRLNRARHELQQQLKDLGWEP